MDIQLQGVSHHFYITPILPIRRATYLQKSFHLYFKLAHKVYTSEYGLPICNFTTGLLFIIKLVACTARSVQTDTGAKHTPCGRLKIEQLDEK